MDSPYLALTGKLWGAYCEDFGENWQRYNGTALYLTALSKLIGDTTEPTVACNNPLGQTFESP